MNWNVLLFEVFPYVAVAVAVIGTIARWRMRPFSISSLSTQLLEGRRLFWGSVPFHWGITLILLGHLAALIVPRAFELWNGVEIQLYLLEITGLALALWTLVGLVVLAVRRLSQARIRVVTTPMDLVVLAVEWGHGRRQGWLSNLHLGARGEDGEYVMVGKTFKGLTDELLRWQTERFLALQIGQGTGRDRHVVFVRAEQVVEVAVDGVQLSTRYPGEVALRFARVRRYRTDKSAAEADSIDQVRDLVR